jgi:hypothetical protein
LNVQLNNHTSRQSHRAHIELLLMSIANYLFPIVTWVLMGNRRSAGTHCWCLGQLILAELALLMSMYNMAEEIVWRTGFVMVNLAFMLCTYALQIELGQKRT